MLYLSTTRKWLINGSAGAGGMSWLAKAATRRSRPPDEDRFSQDKHFGHQRRRSYRKRKLTEYQYVWFCSHRCGELVPKGENGNEIRASLMPDNVASVIIVRSKRLTSREQSIKADGLGYTIHGAR